LIETLDLGRPAFAAAVARGRSARSGSACGFTLLEVLVVLLLMTLLVGLVPPMLSNRTGVQAKSDARQLAAALRYARSQAIVQQRDTDLVLNIEKRRYKITGLRREYPLAENLDISLVTARELAGESSGAIRFYPDGSSTGGRISIGAGGHEYKVDVEWLTGGVAILE